MWLVFLCQLAICSHRLKNKDAFPQLHGYQASMIVEQRFRPLLLEAFFEPFLLFCSHFRRLRFSLDFNHRPPPLHLLAGGNASIGLTTPVYRLHLKSVLSIPSCIYVFYQFPPVSHVASSYSMELGPGIVSLRTHWTSPHFKMSSNKQQRDLILPIGYFINTSKYASIARLLQPYHSLEWLFSSCQKQFHSMLVSHQPPSITC